MWCENLLVQSSFSICGTFTYLTPVGLVSLLSSVHLLSASCAFISHKRQVSGPRFGTCGRDLLPRLPIHAWGHYSAVTFSSLPSHETIFQAGTHLWRRHPTSLISLYYHPPCSWLFAPWQIWSQVEALLDAACLRQHILEQELFSLNTIGYKMQIQVWICTQISTAMAFIGQWVPGHTYVMPYCIVNQLRPDQHCRYMCGALLIENACFSRNPFYAKLFNIHEELALIQTFK